MHKQTSAGDLEAARNQIDRLDDALLDLLAERVKVVQRVGELKRQDEEAPLLDPQRERRLLERWGERAESAGISSHFAGRVLREILGYSRRAQEPYLAGKAPEAATRTPRVAYQGEPCSYSDLAAVKLFEARTAQGAERIGFRTFSAAADALRAGRVDYALLPVENSIAGSIGEVDRLLAQEELSVVDEEIWEVEHVLAARPGTSLANLARVRSHPVALAQCATFLDRLDGVSGSAGVVVEPWHDTAGAAAAVAHTEDAGIAAICSEEAAAAHGLVILRREIADQSQNITRFLLLARDVEMPPQTVACKTSLLLTLDHERGALARCLAAFAEADVNLTRIESRPQPKTPWQYLFFIDVEGHQQDDALQGALDNVRRHCNLLRILGSYPLRTKEGTHLDRGVVLPISSEATTAQPVCKAPVDGHLRLAALDPERAPTIVRVGGVELGGDRFVLIAGPCAVESREQILEAAEMVQRRGAAMLRGGAFKPRSSPYSFQGLGNEGLEYLQEAGRRFDLPVVTEVMRIEDLDAVAAAADMVQVGARNMQNFSLLRALGRIDRPILLKRGLSATVKELLMAAEYIMAGGNQRVILCERGIRTFETATRSTLDVGAVAVLKTRTHLPVIVDPSHAAGVRHLVVPLALAAAAVGADGLIVEAHPNPDEALCDKEQALHAEDLDQLVTGLTPILESRGRSL